MRTLLSVQPKLTTKSVVKYSILCKKKKVEFRSGTKALLAETDNEQEACSTR